MTNSNMEYVGVDYHTKFALMTRMTQSGRIISQDKVDNTREQIRAYIAQLPAGSQVAVEATNNWYAFSEFVYGLPVDLRLVHPAKTKAIATARIKTDSLDSKTLANLLRTNFIAESYLAPQQVRDTRELVRYRTTLVRMRTQFAVRIRSVLFKTGNQVSASCIYGRKAALELEQLELRPIYRTEIESCLCLIGSLNQQIKQLEDLIKQQVETDEDSQLLMTIPGISFFGALLISCELGDYHRFTSSRKLCSWAGLVPSVRASGGKTKLGSITKQGSSNLRFVLIEAVYHVTKKCPGLRKQYQRLSKKHGVQAARVAIARKLLAIMLAMLKSRQPFNALC